MQDARLVDRRFAEIARFVANGLVATAVHYGVLSFNLHVLGFASAGLASFVAAWFGIATSFVGNRFFVFRKQAAPALGQAARFLGLYAVAAGAHGVLLYAWTDVLGLHYTPGFVLATALQTLLSYLANKYLVFPDP